MTFLVYSFIPTTAASHESTNAMIACHKYWQTIISIYLIPLISIYLITLFDLFVEHELQKNTLMWHFNVCPELYFNIGLFWIVCIHQHETAHVFPKDASSMFLKWSKCQINKMIHNVWEPYFFGGQRQSCWEYRLEPAIELIGPDVCATDDV